jgi:hypothetical protein
METIKRSIEVNASIEKVRGCWKGSGDEDSGVVSFEALGADRTRVTLELASVPDRAETLALAAGVERRLEEFRDLVEPSVMEELVSHNWQGF